MPQKKKNLKIDQKSDSKIQEQQNKNFVFSFHYFQTDSLKSGTIKDFNNNFSNQEHFLKVNRCLFEAMKILSNENYKSAFIDNKLVDIMHCKIIDKQKSKVTKI